MKEYALNSEFLENHLLSRMDLDQYYSVEIAISGLGVIYQFRIWQKESGLSFILIRDDSAILPWLNTGDKMNMKYYSTDLRYPYQNLETEIGNIEKQESGRLRGHYLAGLKIIEGRDRYHGDWAYGSDNATLLRLL